MKRLKRGKNGWETSILRLEDPVKEYSEAQMELANLELMMVLCLERILQEFLTCTSKHFPPAQDTHM